MVSQSDSHSALEGFVTIVRTRCREEYTYAMLIPANAYQKRMSLTDGTARSIESSSRLIYEPIRGLDL
jgi:hypothetical protein